MKFMAGILNLGTKGTINISPGGSMELQTGNLTSSEPTGSMHNQGTLKKSGAGTAILDLALLENEPGGMIQVDEGTLSFTGAGQLSGILETKLGADTRFFTGSYTLGWIGGESLTMRGPGPVTAESSALLVSSGGELTLEESPSAGGFILQGDNATLYGEGMVNIRETGHLRVVPDTETEISAQLAVHGVLGRSPPAEETIVNSGPKEFFIDGTIVARPGADAIVHSVSDEVLSLKPLKISRFGDCRKAIT